MLDRQRRQQKDADLDGIVFEDEIEDIPELQRESPQNPDDMMVDAIAQEEEEELNAMFSMYEAQSSRLSQPSQPPMQTEPPALSDDEDYDDIFQDLLSQQEGSTQDLALSGQMDIS